MILISQTRRFFETSDLPNITDLSSLNATASLTLIVCINQ